MGHVTNDYFESGNFGQSVARPLQNFGLDLPPGFENAKVKGNKRALELTRIVWVNR